MKHLKLTPDQLGATQAPELRAAINRYYLFDEQDYVHELLDLFPESTDKAFTEKVTEYIQHMRSHSSRSVIHKLLQEYDLSTDEGITLMCLAESLIRIPDRATANDFLIDKLSERGWGNHVNKSESFWVNAASWGLAISGKMLRPKAEHPSDAVQGLIKKLSLNITREAVQRAIRILGEQFVYAENIESAVNNADDLEGKNQSCSFDMLGEAALTWDDAENYLNAYQQAIDVIARGNIHKKRHPHGISIKLSALHPRYESSQQETMLPELVMRLLVLVKYAKQKHVAVTIDAEEQHRLDISLQAFEQVFSHQDIIGWGEFGLAVQAYSKRAMAVLQWLHALADKLHTQIPVRLVKGAYWDSEIKWAQQQGLKEYPVFTQKASTDLNYLACAKFLLIDNQTWLTPMFATHNARTALFIAQTDTAIEYEFQRLQGMGEALHQQLIDEYGVHSRIYSPVGAHQQLLPYLVRRLIENGANSSFVFQVQDPLVPISHLTEHPADILSQSSILNPNVPLPNEIFVDYPNSSGIELHNNQAYFSLNDSVLQYARKQYVAQPVILGDARQDCEINPVISPCDGEKIGDIYYTSDAQLAVLINGLKNNPYRPRPLQQHCGQVEKIASLFKKHMPELIYLCMKEAGKTMQNALDEVREAMDFCRYYSRQAQKNFSDAQQLDGITGEENLLYYRPKGNVLCISPWNFPLAIFTGQIVAALATGNRVLAKPARQTSLVAMRAVELMYEAGVDKDQLIFLPGNGARIAETLITQNVVHMVCFTGSSQSAKQLQLQLAQQPRVILPILAETGGQNVMLADSTALIEQLITDVIQSAFDSAGQRCSALRVLFIQQDIKHAFYKALKGRMALLNTGNPFNRATDIGPLVDEQEKNKLLAHKQWLAENAELIAEVPMPENPGSPCYFAPCAFELKNIAQLEEEHFGPILHIVPFRHDDLDGILHDINNTGYGLTLGIHSRNQRWVDYICQHVNVGNIYINRNMVGAKVGAQPFGGHGLSGTGPKAGGPQYVHQFVHELTITTNLTAIGGNQDLLS
ncbi:MAG: bifunctional proline dehydrogenase/L-glutamate gamma-semialdehyde dehydrogenase PutA [Oceanospirillaceae bacterium]|nr:bifunctional proline dehydrogenase/L-glutamate gamma-semialdehyde dehydrogenase PutA [Oceanospirillaceae bacterium]MCP5349583.1 bifunctional proline dehydrogenase/L-glutamate gamma-semialdehyde dehydrogenase PutA [Oceanospirillaceae bacterium]